MSRKVIDDVRMNTSIASEPIFLHRIAYFSLHFIYTGTPNGTLYIAVSNDGINWEILTNYSVAINSAGSKMMNVVGAGYSMCKAHFAWISGDGQLTAHFDGKYLT